VSFRLVLERLAEADLTAHADYLAHHYPAVAQAFIDAVERAFARLTALPEIGSPRAFRHARLEGIRMWPVPQFQHYLIFYRLVGEDIQVLRILHAAQDYTRFFRGEAEG
jgi:toxin ParE1/3/4